MNLTEESLRFDLRCAQNQIAAEKINVSILQRKLDEAIATISRQSETIVRLSEPRPWERIDASGSY